MPESINSLEIDNEPFVTLKDAIPGKPYRTVWGYATHGVNGEVLRTVKDGVRVMTKRSWVRQWYIAINANRPFAIGRP